MEIVRITVYACGYYSEQEYEEEVYVSKEFYDKHKNYFDNITLSISELDGKHSKVEADIDFEFISVDDATWQRFDKKSDGDCLFDLMKYDFMNINVDLKHEINIVKDYIKSIDSIIEVSYIIKKSQKEALDILVNGYIG